MREVTEVKIGGIWYEIHDQWGSKVSYWSYPDGVVAALCSEVEEWR